MLTSRLIERHTWTRPSASVAGLSAMPFVSVSDQDSATNWQADSTVAAFRGSWSGGMSSS